MNFSIFLVFLGVSLILANPIRRVYDARDISISIQLVTQYVTVTGDPPQQTTPPPPDRSEGGCTETTCSSTQATSSNESSSFPTSSSETSSTEATTTTSSSDISSSIISTSTSSLPVSSSPSTSETSSPTFDSSPSSSSGSRKSEALSDYAQKILDQHNIHRENSSVDALIWSDRMASMAQRIADTCVYKHVMTVDGGGYGQNIGAGALPENVPALITNLMYNGEIELYPSYGNEPDTSNFEEWGHYSQIVWKETKEVGCATKKCDHVENTGRGVKPYYTVCNYYPQGNISPLYAKNVPKPGNMATVWVEE